MIGTPRMLWCHLPIFECVDVCWWWRLDSNSVYFVLPNITHLGLYHLCTLRHPCPGTSHDVCNQLYIKARSGRSTTGMSWSRSPFQGHWWREWGSERLELVCGKGLALSPPALEMEALDGTKEDSFHAATQLIYWTFLSCAIVRPHFVSI